MRLLIIALVALSGSVSADRYNREVTIINDTDVTLMGFYASTIDTVEWEEDILGADVLRPGYRVNITIDDGTGYCLYDLRADFADGETVFEHGLNVCEYGEWRIR